MLSPEKSVPPPGRQPFLVVITGNPNCGKTTLFNSLTGLRSRVGNYAGVTVERKEGRLQGTAPHRPVTVLDLPGTYSFSPQSPDEQIARDALLQRLDDVPPPDLVVIVIDASNLERNLYYATQVIELGYPTVIALNMMDVAAENGQHVDPARLARELGVLVFPQVASRREGLPALRDHLIGGSLATPAALPPARPLENLPTALRQEAHALSLRFAERFPARARLAAAEALLVLSDEKDLRENAAFYGEPIRHAVAAARTRLEAAGIDWRSATIEARYACAARIHSAAATADGVLRETRSDRLDRLLTHKIWGLVIFLALMALMFQSIFTFAKLPMDALETGVGWAGRLVGGLMPPGDLRSLLVDGVIAGVGAVVVFLPQICLLFLFIGLLEDTGYMARAAFLMDRLMSKVGLHGKSFIPLLSSFACAIPGIMATRTIESPKDRLVTILIAPLMSCSARLPVYALLIATCIPNRKILGFLKLPGLTLLGMYLLGVVVALALAWIFKRTLLKGHTPLLIMELPAYKRPSARLLLRHMWDRAGLFLRNAGTIILAFNILLWFLATYPKSAAIERDFARQRLEAVRAVQPAIASPAAATAALESLQRRSQSAGRGAALTAAEERLLTDANRLAAGEAGAQLRQSFAGRLGKLIEPLIRPLGFDWKIGIGIVSSFAARELFVSTISVVYSVGAADNSDPALGSLAGTLREQRRPDGSPLYTPLTGITLMVFYVIALQCMSTVAIVRRETGGWKWPAFQWLYMGGLAWLLAFLTFHSGRWLGFQ